MISPDKHFSALKNLRILNKYFLKYKWRFLLGTLFVGLSNFFMVLVPQEIRKALDFIITKTDEQQTLEGSNFADVYGTDILKFAGIVIGLSALMGFFMYCMRKTIIVMSRLIEYDMRKEIYQHYQTLDLAFFKRNRTGDLMARISEDVSKVRMYLGPAIMYGIRVALLFSFVIFAMFQVNSQLTMYTLLPLPFLSISIYYVSSIIHKRSDLIQKQISKLSSISQEVYSGIRVVKSYVKEDSFQDYFDEQSEDFKQKSLDLARVNAMFFPLMILLVSASTLITIYVGGTLVAAGEVTTGNLAEFVIYINYLTWPITSIGWIASIVQQAEASQGRINEVLNIEPTIKNKESAVPFKSGSIEFDNVTFTYPDTGITALKNVNFTLKPGEKMAIVGRTASGKSTIADLLMRFYDPTQGDIKIGGEKLQDLNIFQLRNNLGYVPQNVFLFSNSIEENIAFGVNDYKEQDVKFYADKASVKKDIDELPEQFQTVIGERGVTLSGGQKQRLSIARALIKEPEIIIMDDCLSALDANTEHKILEYFNDALADKTAIIITHRIPSQMEFDHILVLENGEIKEFGKHDELIKLGGYYSQMLEKQQETS